MVIVLPLRLDANADYIAVVATKTKAADVVRMPAATTIILAPF